MTQEEKELLLIDLCARLPYGVKGIITLNEDKNIFTVKGIFNILFLYDTEYEHITECCRVESFKPYLRPMSSMTEEESIEYYDTFEWEEDLNGGHYPNSMTYKTFEWLNAHHFDYRGLIEKGLAIAVTEESSCN